MSRQEKGASLSDYVHTLAISSRGLHTQYLAWQPSHALVPLLRDRQRPYRESKSGRRSRTVLCRSKQASSHWSAASKAVVKEFVRNFSRNGNSVALFPSSPFVAPEFLLFSSQLFLFYFIFEICGSAEQ